MTKLDKLIQLMEENNRLMAIFVGPIVALKSEQLAKASIEDQKAQSKATVKRLREKFRNGGKRV
jgi:hypothetical protein